MQANYRTKAAAVVTTAAVFCFVLDFVSKSWAYAHLTKSAAQVFLPGLIELTLVTNAGGAFGLGHQSGALMTLVAVVIVGCLIYWMLKRVSVQAKFDTKLALVELVGFGCLLGGATGNLFNRLTYGFVIDFLNFTFISFPVFNVADICIDLGIALVLFAQLFPEQTEAGK
jgi:signal peptidase II